MKNEYDYLNDVKVDFSVYEEKPLSEKELNAMKKIVSKNKKPHWGRIAALAACVAVVAALSQTAFAKGLARELWFKIVSKVSTGHNEFYSVEFSDKDMPAEYNILFDADGSPIPHDEDYDPAATYYDADGNVITDVQAYLNEKVKELFPEDYEHVDISLSANTVTDTLTHLEENGYTVDRGENAAENAAKHMIFKPLLPEKLPEGYSLNGAAYFSDSGKYLTLIYTNAEGKELVVFERFMDEETAFAAGYDGTVEETRVNGHVAALSNGTTIDWEAGDVSVGLHTGGNLGKEQIIEMAESFK